MQLPFSVMYDFPPGKEVRIYADDFEAAFQTARFLSSISDIRYASLYKVSYGAEEEAPKHVLLCQFQHSMLSKLLPQGEQFLTGNT